MNNMKKIAATAMSLAAMTAAAQINNANAQPQGRIEVYDFITFKLHVYNSNDVMGDASYIIEGADSLITMEEPLFKVNATEFQAYLTSLGKPVCKRVADYHIGSTGNHPIVMAQGMPEFTKGPIYGGMMKGFQQGFGDSMTDLPTGEESEVAFGSTEVWDGVPFVFNHGSSSDFPGASILIGGKVWYSHWAPAKAHMNALQFSSPAAVEAELAAAEAALASGAELYIGGHGGAAEKSAMQFKADYLKTMQGAAAENSTAADFAKALKAAYPDLPGAEGVDAVAAKLY